MCNNLKINNPLILCGFLAISFNTSTVRAEDNRGEMTLGDIDITGRRESSDSEFIGREQIDRFRGTGNGDALSGIRGLQVNSLRNEAGAIDVGVRGFQGEGRVPVIIDGSLQSTHTFRGYQGESDRTYIDMDLISQVQVDRGATPGKYSTGAVGGLVQMKTLGVDDILLPGENFGLLFKGSTYNNNRKPDIPGNETGQQRYLLSESIHAGRFNNGAGTAALAWQSDAIDLVLAYSRRSVGNYFAGKRGSRRFGDDRVVDPGQEVVNTSYQSDSGIAKLGLNLNDNQRLSFNYRRHVQKAGEVMAAYWYKQSNDGDDTTSWTSPPGKDAMPQWSLGSAAVNAASVDYAYQPQDSALVDFNLGLWKTAARLDQHNGAWGTGRAGDQYKLRYTDDRQGINVNNRSSLRAIPLSLEYGAAYDEQRMKPRAKKDRVARDGRRHERSAWLNATLDYAPVTVALGSKIHRAGVTDYRYQTHTSNRAKTDLFGQITLHVTHNIDLYAKASSSWRSPSLFESTRSAQTYNYDPNRPLKPENAWNREAGISGQFSDVFTENEKMSFKVDYFNNHVKDFISANMLKYQRGDNWRSSYSFLNFDSVTTKGVELAASYDNPRFFADASATFYRKPEICSRDAAVERYFGEVMVGPSCTSVGYALSMVSARVPPRRAYNLTVGTRLLDGDLTLGSRLRYHSGKQNPEGWLQGTGARAVVGIPSEKLVDLFARYRVNPQLDLTFNVDNLTNRYTFDPGTVISMPMPGRTLRAGMEFRF